MVARALHCTGCHSMQGTMLSMRMPLRKTLHRAPQRKMCCIHHGVQNLFTRESDKWNVEMKIWRIQEPVSWRECLTLIEKHQVTCSIRRILNKMENLASLFELKIWDKQKIKNRLKKLKNWNSFWSNLEKLRCIASTGGYSLEMEGGQLHGNLVFEEMHLWQWSEFHLRIPYNLLQSV